MGFHRMRSSNAWSDPVLLLALPAIGLSAVLLSNFCVA